MIAFVKDYNQTIANHGIYIAIFLELRKYKLALSWQGPFIFHNPVADLLFIEWNINWGFHMNS